MAIRSVYFIRQLMNGTRQNGLPIQSFRGPASGFFTLRLGFSRANGTGEEFIRNNSVPINALGLPVDRSASFSMAL